MPDSIQYSAIGNFTSLCFIPPFVATGVAVANTKAWGFGADTGSCAASGQLPLGSILTCIVN